MVDVVAVVVGSWLLLLLHLPVLFGSQHVVEHLARASNVQLLSNAAIVGKFSFPEPPKPLD